MGRMRGEREEEGDWDNRMNAMGKGGRRTGRERGQGEGEEGKGEGHGRRKARVKGW